MHYILYIDVDVYYIYKVNTTILLLYYLPQEITVAVPVFERCLQDGADNVRMRGAEHTQHLP